MSLQGKRAIVTGSSGALGAVITQRFLAEGMMVAGSIRETKGHPALGDAFRARLFQIQADVSVESQVDGLFETAVREMGGIDILVNTVGGFLPRKPIPDVSVEEWDHMLNVNLRSTFLCSREALRRMKDQKYGRIINISAMAGLRPSPGRAAYAISKSAVALFTEIVAMEQKGTGVTVNAIAPSIIDTPANRESMPNEDFSTWVNPEHIADIICYLCSETTNDISGTIIKAYGGV